MSVGNQQNYSLSTNKKGNGKLKTLQRWSVFSNRDRIDSSSDQIDDTGGRLLKFEVASSVVVANILYDFAGPLNICG